MSLPNSALARPETSLLATRLQCAEKATLWCQREIDAWLEASEQADIMRDQMAEERLFHLQPVAAQQKPLLLIGGMGPLAGLRSTLQALTHMGNSRELVLFQACKIPCRSRATLAHLLSDSKPRAAVVNALLNAIAFAQGIVEQKQAIDLVVLCNTAHYFLPAALAQLDNPGVRLHSLIDAGIDVALRVQPKCLLPMSSSGTRSSGLYSTPLNAARVSQITTSESQQLLLNHAITDGIKGGNVQTALYWGTQFFSALRHNLPDMLLAGCTEIPPLIELLQESAEPWLRRYLQDTPLLDPVEEVMTNLGRV